MTVVQAVDGEIVLKNVCEGERISPTEARLLARRLFEEAGMAERQKNFPKGDNLKEEKKRTHREYLGPIT